MGTTPANKLKGDEEDTSTYNSMCMQLIQLWLTSFAIGIPVLRLLLFFDFRNSDIVIAVFFTILIFGTMYILDVNDRLWRVDDAQPCNGVTHGEYLNSINISSNQQSKEFETTVETGLKDEKPPMSEKIDKGTIIV